MLPDAIDMCDLATREGYVTILMLVASSDGRLVREENAAIEAAMGRAMIKPERRTVLRQALRTTPSLESVIEGMQSRGIRVALRDSIIIAACDGDYQAEEMLLIGRIAEAAGVAGDVLDELYEWAGRGWDWLAESRLLLDVPLPSESGE